MLIDSDSFVNAVAYDSGTGEVVAVYAAYLDSIEIMARELGCSYLVLEEQLEANPDCYFVNEGDLYRRPAMPVEQDGALFTHVPPGVRVFVDDMFSGVCEDGVVELELTVPGLHVIRFELFPFQTYEALVNES